jgi:hypothetical protein
MKTASAVLLLALSVPAYAVPTIVITKASQSYTVVNDSVVIKKG